MCRYRAVVFALLLGMCGGCFTGGRQRTTTLFDAQRAFTGPTGEDVVQLDVAVVERPFGDRYLNQELWAQADEQEVGLEHQKVLEDNGFRVCQISGLPPTGLQALLTSERSCPDPRRVRLHAGSSTPVLLGPVWPECSFQLREGDRTTTVDLRQAQCLLEVVPTLAEDGRTLLRFTPHVKHGTPSLGPRPLREPSGALRWGWETQQPDEEYASLAWELTVAANEYVVVGTRLDRGGTLGQRCFVPPEDGPRVQRLLVIRTARATAEPPPDEALSRAPPLAMQAAWTCARGTSTR